MAKVLIVDDSQFMRSILKNILTQNGYEVSEAQNGKDALKVYDEVKPDIILLDIIMPEMDGMQVLRTLSREARVVMVTAVGQEEMVKRAMELGAKDFVVKPFNAKKVLETVDKILNKE